MKPNYLDMCQEIIDASNIPESRGGTPLTEWEFRLVSNMKSLIERGLTLSKNQANKLVEIYEK